jgi:hypothetical protein
VVEIAQKKGARSGPGRTFLRPGRSHTSSELESSSERTRVNSFFAPPEPLRFRAIPSVPSNKRLMLPGPVTQGASRNHRKHPGAYASAPFRPGTRDPLSATNAGSIAASPLGGPSVDSVGPPLTYSANGL